MVKEIITIETVEKKMGKKENIFFKVNNKLFIWDEDLGNNLKANIGKSFECEVIPGDYPKIEKIYKETEGPNFTPGIEIVKPVQEAVKEELLPIKQNSRTIGKGDDQVKIYFDSSLDLDEQIEHLHKIGLMPKCWKEE